MTLGELKTRVKVLANDRRLNDSPVSVKLAAGATNGKAWVDKKKRVVYRPDTGFVGTETLVYRVADRNGDTATANVAIDVVCSNCTTNSSITLTWIPSSGNVDGYRVYYGTTPSTATILVSDITTNSTTFDVVADLQMSAGDNICFRIKAYSVVGESGFSDAVCGTV